MASTRDRHAATKFAVVGCLNFCVSSAVFYLCFNYLPSLNALPLSRAPDAAVANVLAYAAGMVNSFVLNRLWTFRATGSAAVQAVRFALVNLSSIAASTYAVFHFVDVLKFPEFVVWAPLTVIVMIVNYLGCKHWAFAPAPALPPNGSGEYR